MLTLVPSAGPFIRVRASGWLGAADYRRFEPEFAAELRRRTSPVPGGMLACPPDRLRVGLLLDMRGFRGWTPGGFVRDLAWDVRNRRTFSKIAVVGDRRRHRWLTVAGRPLFRAPMRFFRPGEQAIAEEWLGIVGPAARRPLD